LFFIVVLILISINNSVAFDYEVKRGLKFNVWNEIWKTMRERELAVRYDIDKDIVSLRFDLGECVEIKMNKSKRDELFAIIAKYKEWNKKASQKKVKLEKEIDHLTNCDIFFKFAGEWREVKKKYFTQSATDFFPAVRFLFFSQTPERHQLVIDFGELIDSESEYYNFKTEPIYLWWNEVIAVENALNENSIEKYKKQILKQVEIEESFN
jgi:hypothetical protein